jgi:hypothetical protein
LLYLVAALAGGNQYWYRLIAVGWNLATVWVFYTILESWFKEKENAYAMHGALLVFVLLTNLPFFEGNIANAELFFLLPTLLAVKILMHKEVGGWNVFGAGVVLGIGGLFKIPAVLECAIWPFVWWASGDKEFWKKSIILGAGTGIVLVGSGLYFASQGVLGPYLAAAGIQNVGYLSSWTAKTATGIFTLNGRAVLVVVALSILWGFTKHMGRQALILGTWGVLTLFAALLSGRPYPHYLMQMAAVLALAVGCILAGKRWEKGVAGTIVVMVILAFKVFGFYWYPTVDYYKNFIKWVSGSQNQSSYFSWFGSGVERNYRIATIIAKGSLVSERVFIWGDEPMIYALAKRLPVGRYTAAYHIKDFRAEIETMNALNKSLPKYIVSFGNEDELPGFKDLLNWKYHL